MAPVCVPFCTREAKEKDPAWVWGEAMGQLSLPYTSWRSVETGLETPMGAGPLP